MPYGITQCYLPPGNGDLPAFTPAEAGTPLATMEGCKAELPGWWLSEMLILGLSITAKFRGYGLGLGVQFMLCP